MPDLLRPNPRLVGPIVVTSAAAHGVTRAALTAALGRFLSGDWGELDADDIASNATTLKTADGRRLMGVYPLSPSERLSDEDTIWIITDGYGRVDEGPEACYTTILFPSDY